MVTRIHGTFALRMFEYTEARCETAQAGPVIGLIAQVLLLAALAGTVGLGAAGWVVGLACAVIMNAALARGLAPLPLASGSARPTG